MNLRIAQLAVAVVLLLGGWAVAQEGDGDRTEPAPRAMDGVAIVEQLGQQLPMDAVFTDHTGKTVRLGELFKGDRPVILSLIYYNCPQLCSLVLNGMVDGLKSVPLEPGKDYDLITVSFDPTETAELGFGKRGAYLNQFGRPGAGAGWSFLTGDPNSIHRLTTSVGFSYKWVDAEQQFAHQAAIYLITPDGRISRYLYGVMFDPSTLRLGLVEAGNGTIGTTVDHFLLTCYAYDPASGSYAASAMAMVRWGGIASMGLIGVAIAGFVWIGRHRRAAAGLAMPNA